VFDFGHFCLLHTGTKQQVRLVRGKDTEVPSHKSEGKRPFWNKFVVEGCWGVYILFIKGDKSRCEVESETVVGVTCGELLAV